MVFRGLGEVIKYGAIRDSKFLAWLEQNLENILALDPEAVGYLVKKNCEIKAEIVSADEKEHGVRAILNLGHTFGHAIENAMGYGVWLHGEAVGLGMRMAAALSVLTNSLTEKQVLRIEELLTRAGLPLQDHEFV